jgi:integrase
MSAVLTALFHGDSGHAVRQHVISCIPLRPEVERVPDISPDTLWRIMQHLPEHARRFPLCLVATGLRMGEYERLERTHLRPETFSIEVPGTKTEASADVISVAADCWEFVDGAVPSPFRYGWIRRLWKQACEAAGVHGITLHDLRHCHGQWAINEGAAEHQVQAQLRHRSMAMTRRYVRARDSRQSADAAGRAVLSAKPDAGSGPEGE